MKAAAQEVASARCDKSYVYARQLNSQTKNSFTPLQFPAMVEHELIGKALIAQVDARSATSYTTRWDLAVTS